MSETNPADYPRSNTHEGIQRGSRSQFDSITIARNWPRPVARRGRGEEGGVPMTIKLPEGWKFTNLLVDGKPIHYIETIDYTCCVGMDGYIEVDAEATTTQLLEAVDIVKQVRGIVEEPAKATRKIVAIAEDAEGRSVAFDDGTMWCQTVLGPEWRQVILPPTKEAT